MLTSIEIDGGHKDAKLRRALRDVECKISRGGDVWTIRVLTRDAWPTIATLMAEGMLPV